MPAKVDTKHPAYVAYESQWMRARDCYNGSDAVKARGVIYLPPLESHEDEGGATRYNAYKTRALFYNATGRTVDGFAGGIFQREPEIKAPPVVTEDQLNDITLTDMSAAQFALEATKEVLGPGRYGVLIDATDGVDARPYWTGYATEDIYNWRIEKVNGDPTLTMVVLREVHLRPDEDNRFHLVPTETFRVLEVVDGFAQQTIHTRDKNGTLNEGPTSYLFRRGQNLTFIPFVFMTATATSPTPQKPPLLDLIDLNLSHYRTSADLEHGRHFTALPQPWISGAAGDGTEVNIGAGGVWILDKDGKAGMLEFTGQGLAALEKADETKRKMMATLGARLLEEQNLSTNETATAVNARLAGDHASLRLIAQVVEQAMTRALQYHAWWLMPTVEDPRKIPAQFILNKDFFAVRMTSEDLRNWVLAIQADAVSFETFWAALSRGGLARPGVEAETEKGLIDSQREEKMEIFVQGQLAAKQTADNAPPAKGAKKDEEKDEEKT